MKTEPILPETEKAIRIEATTPDLDAWVSANAGSGKTTILRNRVIRLLLDGVPPDRILCLTFTKAAAAEMQGRIFAELARWVQLDDATLTREIGALSVLQPEGFTIKPQRLALARTLFARAIEAPGGLKIQTIHAFAERVLHLFPLESGVPLDFTVLGEPDAIAMRLQARQEAIDAAITAPSSPLGKAFSEILAACGTDAFVKALDGAIKELSGLAMRDAAPPDARHREAAYRQALGVPAGETAARIEADFEAGALSAAMLADLAGQIIANRKCSDAQRKFAGEINAVADLMARSAPWKTAYLDLFLTDKGEVTKKAFFAKPVSDANPDLLVIEAEAKAHVAEHLERTRRFGAFTRSLALLIFAEFVLDRFVAAKRAQNALDFDDLIAALRRLLLSGQSGWIMLKLDAAIDHVLIDEAQDTTREMWDIVRGLTDEFFAGEGKTKRPRTIFVVGDEKQSIFSFQGADPAVFEESRLYFAERSLQPKNIRTPVALNSSFRSSDDILGAVDSVFARAERAEGLTASGTPLKHVAARQRFPGLVEIWPPERPQAAGDEGETSVRPKDASVLLAERIADEIAGWLSEGTRHLADGRRIEPGDIVILVRQRNRFFSAMLRALKMRKIPVAGADRLKLQAEIAIRDLLVIAEAVLLKSDDLALATALKSPLFGIDERTLERLARSRTGSLWDAVQAADDPTLQRIAARFMTLHQAVRTQSPLAFFASLLIEPAPGMPGLSGRQAILTRLGPDAADPLDAFLTEAQEFSLITPGSVLLFVLAQRERETEIKRDLEQGGNRVRVMTVHGAKGLEGRIVFLGDTIDKPDRGKEKPAFLLADATMPLLLWAGTKADEPALMRNERQAQRRKLLAEYRRLLYVGMTRAADRLYVGGYAGKLTKKELETGQPKPPPDDPMEWSWYHLMEAGFSAMPGMVEMTGNAAGGTIHRLVSAVPPAAPADDKATASPPGTALPEWLTRPAPRPDQPQPPLRPSKPDSRVVMPERADPESGETAGSVFARRRGILLHQLYEYLPSVASEAQREAGLALLARFAPELGRDTAETLLAPVLKVLSSDSMARIFGPNSRAEVAVAGNITLADGKSRLVSARIDRLVVDHATIEIIDLKTGQPRPAAADAVITRQMALYRAVLRAIYPTRAIACSVLWTETGVLDPIPATMLDATFAAITSG